MLYGRYPFDAQDKGYTKKICAAQYTIPIDVPVSDACKHLLQCLLVANVNERINMKEVLMHPWFRWGLPPGALDMNKPYLAYPLCLDQVGISHVVLPQVALCRRLLSNILLCNAVLPWAVTCCALKDSSSSMLTKTALCCDIAFCCPGALTFCQP